MGFSRKLIARTPIEMLSPGPIPQSGTRVMPEDFADSSWANCLRTVSVCPPRSHKLDPHSIATSVMPKLNLKGIFEDCFDNISVMKNLISKEEF